MDTLLHEISVLPGRVRFKNNSLYYNKPLAKYITIYVDSLYGVKHCNANYITGTILVEYEPDKIEYRLLKDSIEKALYSAGKNGIENYSRLDAYYEAIEKRDRSRRGFVLWGIFYLFLKLKNLFFGKFSISSDIRILGIASAIGIIASYPWFNRLYKKLTSRFINASDMLLKVTAILLTVLRESTEGVFLLMLSRLNEHVRFSADVKSQRLLNQSMLKTAGMAWIVSNNGQEVLVSIESISRGDIIIAHAGELISVEGCVTEGSALINCIYYTGVSMVTSIGKGRKVYDGMSLLSGELHIRVSRIPGSGNKEDISIENLDIHNRVNRYQEGIIPYSMGAAALFYLLTGDILDAMALLLILAPSGCENALSTGIMSYVSVLSKYGIYLKNPNTIERITSSDRIIFDKTGTLTHGRMSIVGLRSYDDNYSESELLNICAACEIDSYHPIAITLQKAAENNIDVSKLESSVQIPSQGIKAIYGGERVLIGSRELMGENGIDLSQVIDIYEDYQEKLYIPILISIKGKLSGMIVLQDSLKEESFEMINGLKSMGFSTITLVTGDSKNNAEAISKRLELTGYHGSCSYKDKELIVRENKQYGTVMMVGDGINDILAMKTADVSLSFANSSCDKAKLHSDCIIFEDDLNTLPKLVCLSHQSYSIIKQSIAISKLYNIAFGLLDFAFRIDPFTAKVIDTFNSLLVLILNKRIEYLSPEEPCIHKQICKIKTRK